MHARIVAIKPKKNDTSPAQLASNIEMLYVRRIERLVEQLRIYPTATSPNYKRSGRLRDEWRWFKSVAGGGVSFVAVNEATNPKTGKRYAHFVQGSRFWQREIMRGYGWKSVDDLLDRKEIAREVQNEINRALGVR